MAYDEQLAERIRRSFKKARVRFEEKRMMGGLCFMVEGKMCVGVDKSRLMARIDPAAYESALGKKGCVPMDFTGRPMRNMVYVDTPGLRGRALRTWVEMAADHVRTLPPKAR